MSILNVYEQSKIDIFQFFSFGHIENGNVIKKKDERGKHCTHWHKALHLQGAGVELVGLHVWNLQQNSLSHVFPTKN